MTSPYLIFRAGEKPKGVMGPFAAECMGACKSCLPSNASATLWASAWQERRLGNVWAAEQSWLPFGSRRIMSSKLQNLLFYFFKFFSPQERFLLHCQGSDVSSAQLSFMGQRTERGLCSTAKQHTAPGDHRRCDSWFWSCSCLVAAPQGSTRLNFQCGRRHLCLRAPGLGQRAALRHWTANAASGVMACYCCRGSRLRCISFLTSEFSLIHIQSLHTKSCFLGKNSW